MIVIMSWVMIMSSLRYRFPLDHKNLMFMVMTMIMFMIFMSLVGTKPSTTRLFYARTAPIVLSCYGNCELKTTCSFVVLFSLTREGMANQVQASYRKAVTRDDLQRRFLAQLSVELFLRMLYGRFLAHSARGIRWQ